MALSIATQGLGDQPSADTGENLSIEQTLSTSAIFVEDNFPLRQGETGLEGNRCPNCGREIKLSDLVLMELCLGEEDMIDWGLPCSHCGKTIKKSDVEGKLQER